MANTVMPHDCDPMLCQISSKFFISAHMLIHAVDQLHPHVQGFLIRKPSDHMKLIFTITGI